MEMVAVMLIIAILSGVAVINLTKTQDARASMATKMVLRDMTYVRQRAMAVLEARQVARDRLEPVLERAHASMQLGGLELVRRPDLGHGLRRPARTPRRSVLEAHAPEPLAECRQNRARQATLHLLGLGGAQVEPLPLRCRAGRLIR